MNSFVKANNKIDCECGNNSILTSGLCECNLGYYWSDGCVKCPDLCKTCPSGVCT